MIQSKLIKLFIIFTLISASQIFVRAASNRHNFHTSLSRLDYNAKDKKIEITIQLFTHDLKPLLNKLADKQLDLEKSPEVDALILEYLSRNFIFKNSGGEQKKLVWVGKELEVDTAYVYLEISSEDQLQAASLQNTIFFESYPEETNLVVLRSENKKADLIFKSGDKFKTILFEENPAQ